MDAPAEREWQNAENDDFDRREARENEHDSERQRSPPAPPRSSSRETYERRRSRDYDHRSSPPPRDAYDRGSSPPPPSRRYEDHDRERERDRGRRGYGHGHAYGRDDRYAGPPPSSFARSREPPVRPSPPPSNIVGAFGLSIRTTERDLEDEFTRAGEVEKVVIVYDARTGRSRGFGFITMKDIETATRAIEQLNNVELHGRRIRVDYSSTTRAHDPTPGEYRGNPRPVGGDRFSRPQGSSYRGSAFGRERGWGERGRGRDRDREFSRYHDSYYDRPPRDRGGSRYDDYPRPSGGWSRRDDRGGPPPPRYRPGSGPDSDNWRRRASPPPRMRSRSPPPRYRDYDDGAYDDRRRPSAPPSDYGRERERSEYSERSDRPADYEDSFSRYEDEPPKRYD